MLHCSQSGLPFCQIRNYEWGVSAAVGSHSSRPGRLLLDAAHQHHDCHRSRNISWNTTRCTHLFIMRPIANWASCAWFAMQEYSTTIQQMVALVNEVFGKWLKLDFGRCPWRAVSPRHIYILESVYLLVKVKKPCTWANRWLRCLGTRIQ